MSSATLKYAKYENKIIFGDCRESMRQMIADKISVQMAVTSPAYFGLRDYGHSKQLGLEKTPELYIQNLVGVFDLVKNLLTDTGTLWLNLGDSYSNKQLLGIPWRVALALQAKGWTLRQDIVWHKPNPMPESVKDRCTSAHEYIFLFSKAKKYYYNAAAIEEVAVGGQTGKAATFKREASKRGQVIPKQSVGTHRPEREEVPYNGAMKNRRSVWTVPTRAYKGAHFATFPPKLIEPCILAGSKRGDIVFDPFMGSGTTAAVAVANHRKYIGCELNQDYKKLLTERIARATEAK
jgi:DNA modification methylase